MSTVDFFSVSVPFNPNRVPGTGFESEGYGAVNVRIRMCEPRHEGGIIQKRYQKVYVVFESNLPIAADVALIASAKEAMFSGAACSKSQQRRYGVEYNYVPRMQGENRVQARLAFGLTSNDVYTEIVVGTVYSVPYMPFKISGLGYVYQKIKATR